MDFLATITDKFSDAITAYLSGLDWAYILTLVLVIKVINAFFPDHIYPIGRFKFNFPTKYRVPTFALILAVISYRWNGYTDRQHAYMYFQSMLASMVLHLWFLDKLLKTLVERMPILQAMQDKVQIIKNTEPKK